MSQYAKIIDGLIANNSTFFYQKFTVFSFSNFFPTVFTFLTSL